MKMLPHEYVQAKDVKEIKKMSKERKIVYICEIGPEDYLNNKGKFNYDEYLASPHLYKSNFHTEIAPYVDVIVNGIYWDNKFPRILTKSQIEDLAASGKRIWSVADISCDIQVL